ncbi:hypothetical protein V1281_001968 [Nitrobacteraceae bacterium AZCC 2161]
MYSHHTFYREIIAGHGIFISGLTPTPARREGTDVARSLSILRLIRT